MMDAYDPRSHPPPHSQYEQHHYAASYYPPEAQTTASASSAYPSAAYSSYDYSSSYNSGNTGYASTESQALTYNASQGAPNAMDGSYAGGSSRSSASSTHSSPNPSSFLDYNSNSNVALVPSHQTHSSMQVPLHSGASASSSARSSPNPSQPTQPASNPLSATSTLSSNASVNRSNQVMVNGTPLSRALTHKETEMLAHLDRLKFFLATAPSRWATTDGENVNEIDSYAGSSGRMQQGTPLMPHPNTHPALNRFLLPSGEYVTCVLWGGLYHITGTDIVRALVFRFEAFGRPVRNMKKFEEGVFSDLRNLKPGTDACLEEPKSPFLDLLFKYQCIRTQKKQKVFYWFSVPHDRLFLDALERDLKREKMSLEPTTLVVGEPALSFTYDTKRSLYEQFMKAQGAQDGEGELETAVRRAEEAIAMEQESEVRRLPAAASTSEREGTSLSGTGTIFNMFSLFEGSPNYKQRRKKGPRTGRSALGRDSASEEEHENTVSRGPSEVVEDVNGELSAAAMFEAQAGIGSGSSRQMQAERQAESQRAVQAQHLALLQQHASGIAKTRHVSGRSMQSSLGVPVAHSHSLPAGLDGVAGGRKTKAYVCPLYSCQRLFKRLEHLKRHVRMHTMERPYQCELCQRRFSRADNLSQHMRTHGRDGGMGGAAPSGDGEVEEGVDQMMYAPGQQYDLTTCEIELSDHPAMPFEDEEYANSYSVSRGQSTTNNSEYYGLSTPQFSNLVMSPENSPRLMDDQSNWTGTHVHSNSLPASYDYTSSHPSPAFSSASAPSSRLTTAYGASTGAYPTQGEVQSISTSFGPISAGSLSAPAHKQTFDHAALYPPPVGVQNLASNIIGPMRRYRSVTPTIARAGEQIRRPLTANTLDASPLGPGAATSRGYHPYTIPQYNAATASDSQQSSPAPYQAQLDYVQQASGTQTNSPAGSTVYQEDLQSLIGLDTATLGNFENTPNVSTGVATYTGDAYQAESASQRGQYGSAGGAAAATANYYTGINALNGSTEYPDQSYSYAT